MIGGKVGRDKGREMGPRWVRDKMGPRWVRDKMGSRWVGSESAVRTSELFFEMTV